MNANLNSIMTEGDNNENTYFPEVSLGIAGRIGIDGESAYEIAVKYGYQGTEEEWAASLVNPADEAAKRAEKAAQQAEEIITDIDKLTDGKASLDNAKEYVIPSQINPLHGLQTGIKCENGYYSATGGLLTDISTKTVELLFTTPAELSGTGYLLGTSSKTGNINVYLTNNELYVNAVKSYIKTTNIRPGNTYHLVMVFTQGTQSKIYLNGIEIGKGNHINEISTSLSIGNNLEGDSGFKGTIHRLRLFNSAISKFDVDWLWNEGRPGDIKVLSQSGHSLSPSCHSEYDSWSLLPNTWRDMNRKESNMKAIGNPEYSYIVPQDMNVITVSTGRFYKNIDITIGSSLAIHIPAGYSPIYIAAKNYNPNNLTDFQIVTNEDLTKLVPPSTIRHCINEDRLVWNLQYCMSSYEYMLAYATGNKPQNGMENGMEIITTYKWMGSHYFK